MVRPLQGLAGKVGGNGFSLSRGDRFPVSGNHGLRGDDGRKLSREEGESRCGGRESSLHRDIFSHIIYCHNEIFYSMTAFSPDVGISGDGIGRVLSARRKICQ